MTPHISRAGIAILPIGLATALSLTGDATLYAVLPTHYADAGIALASVGLILSANRFIRLLTNGPAGWLFDQLPDRRVLFLASLVLGIFASIIYATTFGLEPFFFARLLWGLAWSGIWIGGTAIVLQMAPDAERGHWVGIYQAWFFFGSALGSFAGGALTDLVGFRNGVWISIGISTIGAIAAALALSTRQTNIRNVEATMRRRIVLLPDVRHISASMWMTALAQCINRLAGAGIVGATLGLIVRQNIGAEMQWGAWSVGVASMTGGLLASRTLLSLVGAPIAGTMSDRIGNRWSLLALSLSVGAIGIAILPLPQPLLLISGTIISSIASGSVQSLATALVGDLSRREDQGKNLAIFNIAGDLGSAIGPIATYALLSITGLTVVYWGCAILMLANGFWIVRFSRTPSRH